MDIFELIRTVDGGITIGVLLFIYRDLLKRLDTSAERINAVLLWFMGRTDIPK